MVLGYTRPGHRQVHNFELQKVTQNLLQESNTESGALLGRVGGLYGRRQFGFDVASHTLDDGVDALTVAEGATRSAKSGP
jgi:hypothetical protein